MLQEDTADTEVVSISSSEVKKKPAGRGLKRPATSADHRPATSQQKQPYLKMYYSKTGKAALKDNSNGKQLFQFGSKDKSKEDLYDILDKAIEMILSEQLDVDNAKAWCSAQM